jgi:hypothetical protein
VSPKDERRLFTGLQDMGQDRTDGNSVAPAFK